jgi:protein-disulfide isomerase
MQQNPASSVAIPIAIVFGFGLIAAAIYFSGTGAAPQQAVTPPPAAQKKEITVRPLDETDYIRGNPNAPIVIVEYSDYDCPFCKNFHDTMRLVMEEFGASGKVAWTYRQFPIVQLHPNAPRISEAAYCVGDLAGTNAFWTFSDLVFDERSVNAPTSMTRLNEFAVTAGADEAAFVECLNSGKNRDRVQAALAEGIAAGAEGTPYSILIAGDQQVPINGAQSFEYVSGIIRTILTQIEGAEAAN